MQVLTEMDASNDQQADYSSQACRLLATAALAVGLQLSLVLLCCLTMIILCMVSLWHA